MSALPTIAIIGAGPGGLYLASLLARRGYPLLLFDPQSSWDMRTGTYIQKKHLEDRTWFTEDRIFHPVGGMKMSSEKGLIAEFPLSQPVHVTDRESLIETMKNRFIDEKLCWIPVKIRKIEKEGLQWILKTKDVRYQAQFLIGADGGGTLVRESLHAEILTQAKKMTLEAGAFIHWSIEDFAHRHYLTKEGRLFSLVPVLNGTLARLVVTSTFLQGRDVLQELDVLLETMMQTKMPPKSQVSVARIYPYDGFSRSQVMGENWMLMGEAAGFIDPLTYEGTRYSILNAEILADSFQEDRWDSDLYLKRLKKEIIRPLQKRLREKKWYRRFRQYCLLRKKTKTPQQTDQLKGLLFS